MSKAHVLAKAQHSDKKRRGPWELDQTRILSAGEVHAVLLDLKRRARRSVNSRTNLIVFRLAVCCGLRASEIAGIKIADVRLSTTKPVLYVRKEVAKGGRARRVPLWWDQATLEDLTAWREFRLKNDGAKPRDPLVCTRAMAMAGHKLHRNAIRSRFLTGCRSLGKDRIKSLTVHDGRHTFVSHAIRHRTLVEVRMAAGHRSVATTNIYLHLAVDDDGKIGNLFP